MNSINQHHQSSYFENSSSDDFQDKSILRAKQRAEKNLSRIVWKKENYKLEQEESKKLQYEIELQKNNKPPKSVETVIKKKKIKNIPHFNFKKIDEDVNYNHIARQQRIENRLKNEANGPVDSIAKKENLKESKKPKINPNKGVWKGYTQTNIPNTTTKDNEKTTIPYTIPSKYENNKLSSNITLGYNKLTYYK